MRTGDIIQVARLFAAEHPAPVCAGCPEGEFEKQVATWLGLMAEQLAFELGIEAGVREGKLYARDKQTQGLFRVHVPTVNHTGGGLTVKVDGSLSQVFAGEGPPVWAEPLNHLPPPEVDRMQVILDTVQQLGQRWDAAEKRQRARDVALDGLVKRLLVLTAHYGSLPLEGTVKLPVVGEVPVQLRPVDNVPRVQPPTAEEFTAKAYEQGAARGPRS